MICPDCEGFGSVGTENCKVCGGSGTILESNKESTMNDEFLPKNYEAPEPESRYMKFKEGKNIFRILSSAVIGYEYWIDTADNKRKPVRFHKAEEVPEAFKNKAKHFWAMIVWNYTKKEVQILEVTQSGIRNAILSLVHDEDWGNPKDYDITVTRVGKDLETEYQVMPRPKTVMEMPDISGINLEALYSGDDPFSTKG